LLIAGSALGAGSAAAKMMAIRDVTVEIPDRFFICPTLQYLDGAPIAASKSQRGNPGRSTAPLPFTLAEIN
jgi:hypothetical protein